MQGEYRCQICGKPATKHYIETINGITTEAHYCDECASNAKMTFDINNFSGLYGMSGILSSIFGGGSVKRERVCSCGMTERELLNSCKFGCAECYKTFDDIAKRLVDNIGGGAYVGAEPCGIESKNTDKTSAAKHEPRAEGEPKSEIDKLLAELDVAIKEERFVDCDKLKKKIDKLRADKKKEG